MINWNNLDTLEAFKELKETPLVDLNKVMSGEVYENIAAFTKGEARNAVV